MKRYLLAVWLVVVWVAMWGQLTVANVLSGIVVAAVLLTLLPVGGRPPRYRFRLVPFLRLAGFFFWQLLVANLAIVRQVLQREANVATGVVGVPLLGVSDGLLTLVVNLTALTPGTIPIEIRRDPLTLYVHVLRLQHPDDVRREVRHLEHLVVHAFGPTSAIALLDRTDPQQHGRGWRA